MKTQLSNSLKGAKNIGPTIEKRLNEIGIYSLNDLAAISAVEAYVNICKANPDKTIPVCYYLYSLQGALLNTHWNDLPDGLKTDLRQQIEMIH